MGFHHIINLVVLLTLATAASSLAASACLDRCGNVSIPFPFGTPEGCSLDDSFFVTCNQTSNPPRLFLQNTTIEITEILPGGQLKVMHFISHDCYTPNGTRDFYNDPFIGLSPYLRVNNSANKFIVVGCDSFGYIEGKMSQDRDYKTGCMAMCTREDDLVQGSCKGSGCCEIAFPEEVWGVNISLGSFKKFRNLRGFNNCSYAFVVEATQFSFSRESLTSLMTVNELPMVLDWAIGDETCEQAEMNKSAYACKSANSRCYKPHSGYGYRCSCQQGYHGNAYILHGCQDIDECGDRSLNVCEKRCINTPGSFHCRCPKGYDGDGRKDGRGCVRDDSFVYKLVAGVALGVIVLMMSAFWLRFALKRRKLIKLRRKFFGQNGGNLLLKELDGREGCSNRTKIFSASELQKATNNFHKSTIIGQGGYGIVYEGSLPDNLTVAIKKPKDIDRNQIQQFINEVIVLSQINHRNVVKLLGCCFETEVPLLVYEFISNGTLYEHIHNKAKYITWDMRLKIAMEIAGVLSYLHSDISIPIIHRDVKSTNILLDDTHTAKVSDFGASKLVPIDQAQLCTMVQGTFGYLDPEYMQTNQLTEKSDVYSFGVVLVELLTGMKAWSYERPEKERNLANIFLKQEKEHIFELFEDNVLREGNKEELMKVATLAERCLRMRGDERPSMKEIAMELQGLSIVKGKHSWDQTEHKVEGKECLLEGVSASTEFHSLRDEVIVHVGDGR